jgi:hypothetical protein
MLLDEWRIGGLELWNPGTKEQQQNLRESALFKSAKICEKQSPNRKGARRVFTKARKGATTKSA